MILVIAQVCNYIREKTQQTKEAYIKQVYKPGETLQFDYRDVKVSIAGEKRTLSLALFTTGYYDNLKQEVSRFIGPTEKEATEDLIKLSLYYKFKYRFCNV